MTEALDRRPESGQGIGQSQKSSRKREMFIGALQPYKVGGYSGNEYEAAVIKYAGIRCSPCITCSGNIMLLFHCQDDSVLSSIN